jgi:hypothetical protein
MAHDLKGKKLKAGDKVNVPCVVDATKDEGVVLRPRHVAPGEVEAKTFTLHSAQTKKSEAKG